MPIVIFILFGVLVGILIYGYVLFGRLLRTEHLQYPETWKEDGSPMFIGPRLPGYRWIVSDLAAQWLMVIWFSDPPAWIEESPVLRIQLRRYRWCMLISYVGLLALFVVTLITHPEVIWGLLRQG